MAKTKTLQGSKIPLGTIDVGKEIGKGGFGVVHEATISGINVQFAIKFLDPHPGNSVAAAARERFIQEAEILFNLRHPQIIGIYNIGERNGKPYILMERFPGMDLQRVREDYGTISPMVILPFLENIADALGYAHSKNIVHRDITPRNLMTRKGGDCRVLDFGIAALLDPDETRLTRTGGTFNGDSFCAPELIENPKLLDPRCDVFSLGACWFWLLTGRTPKGVNWQGALRNSVKLSPDYERVLLRCLDQADVRYASMKDLADAIRALRSGQKPRTGIGELTDEDALFLGVVADECATPGTFTTFYHIEQRLNGALSGVARRIAINHLLRLDFIEIFVESDINGNGSHTTRPTSAGDQWIETHQSRITELMKNINSVELPVPETEIDDAPF